MASESRGHRQLPLFPVPDAPRADPPRVEPAAPVSAASSLAVAAGAFDEHLARAGKTEHTRRAFASDLRLVMRRLGSGRLVAGICSTDLDQFLSWMLEYREKPCSPKTYARRVTTLKVFFAWLVDVGALASDPAAGLVHRHAEAPLPHVLRDRQVTDLLDAASAAGAGAVPDPRPELLVRLLLDAGLKKGEIVRLRLDDVAPSALPPSLIVRYDQARWKSKERRVSFDPRLVPLIEAYVERYAPTERLFGCSGRNLEYVLHDLVAAAGLPARTGFETLRWTSALRHLTNGMDHEELRERLGLSPVSWAETERKLELLAASGTNVRTDVADHARGRDT